MVVQVGEVVVVQVGEVVVLVQVGEVVVLVQVGVGISVLLERRVPRLAEGEERSLIVQIWV